MKENRFEVVFMHFRQINTSYVKDKVRILAAKVSVSFPGQVTVMTFWSLNYSYMQCFGSENTEIIFSDKSFVNSTCSILLYSYWI